MLSNPEIVSAMIKSNPEAAEMIKQHPEIEAALSDPNTLKSLMSPDMLKSASGMIERMQSLPKNTTMSGAPGSFPMPGTPGQKEEERKASGNMSGSNPWAANPFAFNPFAQMMGINKMNFSPFSNIGSMNTGASNTGTTVEETKVDDKVKYKAQLEEMKSMGFTNEEENLKALKETNGDVFEAIDKIGNKD
jgi:ubiquilin